MIDTAEKRRSAAAVSYQYYSPGVTPNALKDAEWRQQAGHGYSGIAIVTIVVIGDIYNASAIFPTGNAVTISLYDPITLASILLDDSACLELNSIGLFVWNATKLTTQPVGYKEYVWQMTDGISLEGGVIRVNTMGVDDLMGYIMENGETFAESQRLQRAAAAGTINQAADGSYAIRDAADLIDRIVGDDSVNNGRSITGTNGA